MVVSTPGVNDDNHRLLILIPNIYIQGVNQDMSRIWHLAHIGPILKMIVATTGVNDDNHRLLITIPTIYIHNVREIKICLRFGV